MKKLKSLEEYSSVMDKITSLKNDDYYKELSDDDRIKMADDLVEMNQDISNLLEKKFKSLGYRKVEQDVEWCISAKSDWVNIHVYSCSNEWFIVVVYGYYKCDQIDGVIHLIDDIQKCIN